MMAENKNIYVILKQYYVFFISGLLVWAICTSLALITHQMEYVVFGICGVLSCVGLNALVKMHLLGVDSLWKNKNQEE